MNGRMASAAGLAAAVALAVLFCAPAYDVDTLFKQLQSVDAEERLDAQERIDKIIREGDFEVFARGAVSPVKWQRAPSITYLGHMRQPGARAALRDLLRLEKRSLIPYNPIQMKPTTEESDSRILVANVIAGSGGDPEAVGALIEGMEGQSPEVLIGTCYAVGALRDPKGISFLSSAARHQDVEVVRAAVQALGTFRTPEVLEVLKSLIGHPSLEVRSEVLSALQLQTDPATVGILEAIATSDPSPDLRVTAIAQLGFFSASPPVPFLIQQLKGKDEASRRAALESLHRLSGQSYGPRPEEWTRWWEQSPKPLASRR